MTKRYSFLNIGIVSLIGVIFLLSGCKKDDEENNGETEYYAPTVAINSVTMIGQKWATMRGVVKSNGLPTEARFEYGIDDTFGNVITTIPDSINETGFVDVYASITGLDPDTEYICRLVAENDEGIVYGEDTLFITLMDIDNYLSFDPLSTYETVADIEGNTYKTIQIGTQTWMAENLRTQKFKDGTDIEYIAEAASWKALETSAYSWYYTDTIVSGALYNWYAVNTGDLCPDGWSVPTDADWTELTDYLGGAATVGEALKESGSRHWLESNENNTNASGFTALPGGYRTLFGGFGNIGNTGYWWTSTENVTGTAFYRSMYFSYSNVDRGSSNVKSGFSVRCIKNPVTK